MTTPILDVTQILDKRYALRNLLENTTYHNRDDISIPKEECSLENNPKLKKTIYFLAESISKNPTLILDPCLSMKDIKKDWNNLVKKVVIKDGNIIKIDARARTGQKIIDNFMWGNFYNTRNYKGNSVISEIKYDNLVKALVMNVMMHSTPYKSEIIKMIVAVSGLAPVTKFRALTTKAILNYFGAKTVLDPCIGWGGRMLGTLATSSAYIGCEPDPITFSSLEKMKTEITTEITQNLCTLFNLPAEEGLPLIHSRYGPKYFDMILTSPPYFNLELYGGGKQSTNSYTNWDDWVNKWLLPVVTQSLELLKDDGISCWSVKNFKSDKVYHLEDVVKKIHNDRGWKLVKTVCMEGSSRMGSGRIDNGVEKKDKKSKEETFCFRKA